MAISEDEAHRILRFFTDHQRDRGLPDFDVTRIGDCFVAFEPNVDSYRYGYLEGAVRGIQTYMARHNFPNWTGRAQSCFFFLYRNDIPVDYADLIRAFDEQRPSTVGGLAQQGRPSAAAAASTSRWLRHVMASPIPEDPADHAGHAEE